MKVYQNRRRTGAGIATSIFPWGLMCLVFLLYDVTSAQYVEDKLLFSVELNDDTTTLFGCDPEGRIESMIAGPVVLQDGSFLFYSSKGYALYSRSGRLKDSHSVVRKNKKLSKKGKPLLSCAFPLDDNTLLFYKRHPEDRDSSILMSRKIGGWLMRKTDKYPHIAALRDIKQTTLFNLTANALTYEMKRKSFLQPYLVGYTSIKGGTRWWSLDRFFSFTSPLIVEEDENYISFFPGLTRDPAPSIKKNLVEPLGVCLLGNTFHYYGVHTPAENKEIYSYQRLFLCDQAGNLLYDQKILKREMTDAVIGENEMEKMQYTVKRPSCYVFLPAVDRMGNIYYGVVNFYKKQIEVMQRPLAIYKPSSISDAHQDLLKREQGFSYRFDPVDCMAGKTVRHLPLFRYNEVGSEQEILTEKELNVKGYLARIVRAENESLKATINRSRRSLPPHVQRMQDSLSGHFGAWCPYAIELMHESETIREFSYPLGSRVVAVRVVAVTDEEKMFVRVDLGNRAEMLVFTTSGDFLNRFTFNQEPFDVRADVIAVTDEEKIVEKDYELSKGGHRFQEWKPVH
ncbi:MAG: hypothetical protein ACLFSB_11550 [Chitinispirillaceae bacterium]